MVFSLRYFLCLFLLSLPCTSAFAQTSPKDVAHSLEKKTLLLRDGYSEDNLAFDPQGNPSGNITPGNFPLSAITVQKIKIGNSELEIQGKRNILILTDTNSPSETADIRSIPIKKRKVRITLQEDTAHPEALALAIQKIFALSTQDLLAEKIPEQRERWLASLASFVPDPKSIKAPVTVSSIDGFDKIYSPKQGVTIPRLIFALDPEYPPEAKRKMYGGTSVVSLIVDQAGNPEHIRVIQPLGYGFDEKAVIAVSQYRFKPSTLNGQPVSIEMHVEINFHIF
jgi:TonB family protein